MSEVDYLVGVEEYELAFVEDVLDAAPVDSQTVYKETIAMSERAIAAVAAKRAGGGGGGSEPVVLSDTDPGAIGAGNLWCNTTPTEEPDDLTRQLLVRNDADDGWVPVGLASFIDDVLRAAVVLDANGQLILKNYDDAGDEVGHILFSIDNAIIMHGAAGTDIVVTTTDADITINAGGTSGKVWVNGSDNNAGATVVGTKWPAEIRSSKVAPTVGAGLASIGPGICLVTDAAAEITQVWTKTGAGDTDWSVLAAGDFATSDQVAGSIASAVVRTAAGVPSGSPDGDVGECPFAFDTTAVTGGFYYWNGAAWVKVATIL